MKAEVKINFTTENMLEDGFSLPRILLYEDRIVDSVLIRENTGQ